VPTDVYIHGDYKIAVKKACLKSNDHLEILDELSKYPEHGDPVVGAGILRKLRVKFVSRRIGKRSGLRVIYYYDQICSRIWLLSVYYKGDKEDITPQEIRRLEKLAKSL